jgi:hypothetical protein
VIDTKAGGAYSGVITGGNARAVSPAQTFSYAFDVPKKKQDLTPARPGERSEQHRRCGAYRSER